jgi:hypothetical protein
MKPAAITKTIESTITRERPYFNCILSSFFGLSFRQVLSLLFLCLVTTLFSYFDERNWLWKSTDKQQGKYYRLVMKAEGKESQKMERKTIRLENFELSIRDFWKVDSSISLTNHLFNALVSSHHAGNYNSIIWKALFEFGTKRKITITRPIIPGC